MKYLLSLLVLFGLLACEAESDPDNAGGSSNNCPNVGDLTVEKSSGLGTSGRCLISGTLTQTATLNASTQWHLNGPLIIGDGSSSPILTIEAGVEVFAGADGANLDYIYIAPGASINAIGSVNDPIILSSDDEDYEGSGEWGGLIIEDTAATSGQVRLEHLVVTEAGGEVVIGNNSYADNIVLEGVHDDTFLQFIQSHDSARDGIRLQSSESTANQARLSWLLITGANRDGLSYNHFSGLVKDLLVIHRPSLYDGVSGGRAGIYAANSDSQPLFVNVTLVGRDPTSNNSISTEEREVGVIFAENSSQFRMANTLILNFRNGCYEVDATSDLSIVSLSSADLTQSFMGGVHCGHENSGLAGNVFVPFLLRSGAENFSDTVLNDGIQFYGSTAFNFYGETNPSTAITSTWYLISIGSLLNDLVVNTSNTLDAFANGDTNGDSTVNADDVDFQPLLNEAAPFFGSVTGSAVTSQGYDLTNVGVIRNESSELANQFDGWTLQAGGVFPQEVTGFAP